jgi:hypothetical protein
VNYYGKWFAMPNKTVRIPVDIPVHPYMLDHCFEGKVVLPAVEAMQVLADTVKGFRPDADITVLTDAGFDKFLYIEPGITQIAAFSDIAVHENGDIAATLLTKSRSQKSAITRIKEHASLCFSLQPPELPEPPLDATATLDGRCFKIPVEKIYCDLVPFGPAYQNIRRQLLLSEYGAIAKTAAPPDHTGADSPECLGSPFVLDAAFHAACAWGQRYARMVAFPVKIEKRVIFKKTLPGTTYISRILPLRIKPDLLIFDIWIYDQKGHIFEAVTGVRMRDVSAGRLKPPRWIMENIV